MLLLIAINFPDNFLLSNAFDINAKKFFLDTFKDLVLLKLQSIKFFYSKS